MVYKICVLCCIRGFFVVLRSSIEIYNPNCSHWIMYDVGDSFEKNLKNVCGGYLFPFCLLVLF